MEKIIVAKWQNKIYQIVRVVDRVAFSEEKEWILLSNQINKKDSIQVRWVRVKDVRFDWVRVSTKVSILVTPTEDCQWICE